MKKTAIIITLMLMAYCGYSQRDALYSQFMFNKLIINPAYSGSRDALTLTLLDRYQWVGFGDGSPRTLTFSAHTPLRNEKIALGMYFYNDRTGPFSDVGFMGNYAYRIRLFNGILSLGLQAGFNQVNVNWDEVKFYDPSDPLRSYQPKNSLMPDANFGVYYYTKNYYLGVSSKQLFESQYGKVESEIDGESTYAKLARHFYGMAGAAIPFTEKVVFRPGFMFKYTDNAPLNFDINASFLFNNLIWLGASYRTNYNAITTKNALVFMAELNLTKNWRLGYSYDSYLSDIRLYNQGSHEIMISYEANIFKPRVLTPRYF
ncbi:MAG TPA: type IX secretion system membrane protein PorP/SprF [Lentimicrobium sp.]|nr:type IX secretion system membrane protein PorP/SprF [Lentimicrobium sp.]